MGFFRTLLLLSAFVSFALGGYLYFVSSEAPDFFLWGDLKNNALIFFLAGVILIFVWLTSKYLANKIEL
ncbi:MAG: hypothetical protein P8X87_05870 [Candidatus Bathyarchaeota archaeon]